MFVLVGCGSLLSFLTELFNYYPRNDLFTIVSIFRYPIHSVFFGIPTFLPVYILELLKWAMLFFVIHRLLIFIKIRNVSNPDSFRGVLVVLSAISVIALILFEVTLYLFFQLPLYVWSISSTYLSQIAPNILPLVFAIVEILEIKKNFPSYAVWFSRKF